MGEAVQPASSSVLSIGGLVDVKLCEDMWSAVCTSSGARRQDTEDSDKRIWFSVASEQRAVYTPTPESALWHRAAHREASCACAICLWTFQMRSFTSVNLVQPD